MDDDLSFDVEDTMTRRGDTVYLCDWKITLTPAAVGFSWRLTYLGEEVEQGVAKSYAAATERAEQAYEADLRREVAKLRGQS